MDTSNRQERLQMRQRGAGTRKIDAVDFGISFDPIPRRSARNTPRPASQRRQSRTPLTARGALRRPSKTPSKAQPQSTVAEPANQGSATASARSRPNVYDAPVEDAPDAASESRSRKKRKLSADQENNQLITPATSQVSAPSHFGKRSTSGRKSSDLPIQIAEVPEQAELESIDENVQLAAGNSPGANKENAVPGMEMAKTPRIVSSRKTPRTRRSSVSSRKTRSSRSVSRQSDNVSILSATGDVDSEDEVMVAMIVDNEEEALLDTQEEVSLMTAQGEVSDSTMELAAVLDDMTFNGDVGEYNDAIDPGLLPEGQVGTLAPRSANIKKKRSSLNTPSQSRAERTAWHDMLQLSSEISSQQAQSELATPRQAEPTPNVHPASDDSFYQANHEDEDETYLQPTSPVIPTPKPVAKKPRQKKPTAKPRRSSTSSTTQNRRKKSNTSTFPVLIHRLSNTSALPTITEEAEEDENSNSDGELNSNQTIKKFHNRSTPNAIDVLAQFCREDIEAALGKLSTHPNTSTTITEPTPPAALKRKRTTITAFHQALEARLFDLSTAVEHRLALEARVKQSARDKTDMQARWMEVRRERERVARKMDEVRREKEERARETEEVRGLSEALWRVELEVERGVGLGGGDEEGGDISAGKGLEALEWQARTLVSGLGGSTGLLERVREFNAVLERTVGVLDRRKG